MKLRSVTGREVTLPPVIRLDTNRKATNDLRKQREWLAREAVAEATTRGDEFALLQFQRLDPRRMSPADCDSAHEYLFGHPHEIPDALKS